VRALENGSRKPSPPLAHALAQALQIPDQELARFIEFALAPVVEYAEARPISVDQPAEPVRGEPIPPTPTPMPPVPITPLIGRTEEITRLVNLMTKDQVRLLTITGLGGVGKTHLALAVAVRIAPHFRDGVWFVDLQRWLLGERNMADLAHNEHCVDLFVQAIGTTLGAPVPTRQLGDLLAILRSQKLCLVLDNFDACMKIAPLLRDILLAAPGVTLLLTSRLRLGMSEEQVIQLRGLAVPINYEFVDVVNVPSVQLFAAAAQRHLPSFSLTPANCAAVAHICVLVEGLPLALLIAAAWVEHLEPVEIAAEIQRDLAFLDMLDTDAVVQQRSVIAVLNAMWATLSETDRRIFAQLSIFEGRFSGQAAQMVADATPLVLRTLVNRSLLDVSSAGLYRFPALVQEFARQKLADMERTKPALVEQTHQRHACFFAKWLRQLASEEHSAGWFAQIEEELPNIYQALNWCTAHSPVFLQELALILERSATLAHTEMLRQASGMTQSQPKVEPVP
jgi:predicted ATPase